MTKEEKWEQEFECSDCGIDSIENFTKVKNVEDGEIWACNNCRGTILVNHKPYEVEEED